ncbi:hypothetical protein PCANC_11558 [Puccinia coronata f. sp. avenae]|uniref:Uncharacterized protein n=1 Tax=Puccinia coronata f. sp. avenae TaxID=200324 RepID=A0A2N5RXE4_9BASI|nr:hypothetical protein PCANC_28712 [Puccinia coronata f. sp. avenae]PLW39994.1 hypothetical protein PCANC_11558 [Puccinia coronata f. sp. avenae]
MSSIYLSQLYLELASENLDLSNKRVIFSAAAENLVDLVNYDAVDKQAAEIIWSWRQPSMSSESDPIESTLSSENNRASEPPVQQWLSNTCSATTGRRQMSNYLVWGSTSKRSKKGRTPAGNSGTIFKITKHRLPKDLAEVVKPGNPKPKRIYRQYKKGKIYDTKTS